MTPQAFETLVLRLGAVEARPVLDCIRFQVAGRVFATLGWPGPGWAVVQLPAAAQKRAIAASRAFRAEEGPRGERGVTLIRLAAVEEDVLSGVLADAWREAYRRAPAAARRNLESTMASLGRL